MLDIVHCILGFKYQVLCTTAGTCLVDSCPGNNDFWTSKLCLGDRGQVCKGKGHFGGKTPGFDWDPLTFPWSPLIPLLDHSMVQDSKSDTTTNLTRLNCTAALRLLNITLQSLRHSLFCQSCTVCCFFSGSNFFLSTVYSKYNHLAPKSQANATSNSSFANPQRMSLPQPQIDLS